MSDCAVREPGAGNMPGRRQARPGARHPRSPGGDRGRGRPGSWSPPDAARRLQLALGALLAAGRGPAVPVGHVHPGLPGAGGRDRAGNPAFVARPAGWAAGFIGQHPGAANALYRGRAAAASPRHRLAADGPGRPRRVGRLGARRLVARRGPRRGADPGPDPGHRRARSGDLVRAARRAGMAASPPGRLGSAPGRPVTAAPFIAAPFAAARPAGPRAARLLCRRCGARWPTSRCSPLTGPRWHCTTRSPPRRRASAAGWPWPGRHRRAARPARPGRRRHPGRALAAVAAGVWLPVPAARAAIVLAVLLAGVLWVIGQGLGGLLTGAATDPDTGPLLALLALAYWPVARCGPGPGGRRARRGGADSRRSGRRHDRPVLAGRRLRRAMLLTAGYCAGRLVAARVQRRPAERDVDLVHVLMGVAMAGMLVPRISLRPAGLWTGIWAVVFAAAAGWFAWRAGLGRWLARRPGPPARPPPAPPDHVRRHGLHAAGGRPREQCAGRRDGRGRDPLSGAGHRGGPVHGRLCAVGRRPAACPRAGPGLAVCCPPGHRPGRRGRYRPGRRGRYPPGYRGRYPPAAAGAAPRPPLSPRLAACCNIAMGLAMGYMLVMAL